MQHVCNLDFHSVGSFIQEPLAVFAQMELHSPEPDSNVAMTALGKLYLLETEEPELQTKQPIINSIKLKTWIHSTGAVKSVSYRITVIIIQAM